MHVYQIKRNLHIFCFNFPLFDNSVILFFTKRINKIVMVPIRNFSIIVYKIFGPFYCDFPNEIPKSFDAIFIKATKKTKAIKRYI